ncbi:MAG TPA: ATP-binding cassette domain-containing protein, partial [Pirellulales bacterium]
MSKSFDDGASFVVNEVSLEIATGTLTALLGGSGCGKTTTLRMINRLIEPTSGRIFVHEQNILDADPVMHRRGIGYVVQGAGLFPHFSVAENVAVVPKLLGWAPSRIRDRVNELLDLVELPPSKFRDRLPAQLSGGQQQRVGF